MSKSNNKRVKVNKRIEKQELKIKAREEKKKKKIVDRVTKKSGKILKWVVISIGVLVFAAIAMIIFVLFDKYSKMETIVFEKNEIMINTELESTDLGEGYLNVAIFGVDSRDGQLEAGTLSDTIIVASLNNETKELKMVSVYRDTILNMSNGSYNKANAAYALGGPAQGINMLNTNLDLNIEKYVAVDFSIVVDIIDLLGGIEIEVDKAEISGMNKYIPETARVSGVEANLIENEGLQLLDGAQATTYARIRSTAGGDFKRTDRQRYVISKIVDKLKVTNLLTLNKIVDTALPRISTNFTAAEIAIYAAAYLDFYLGPNTGFPEIASTGSVTGLGSCVIPQSLQSNVKDLHEFLFEDTEYQPSSKVISNSNAIASRTAGMGGGIGNTNTQYSTHNEFNVANIGVESSDLSIDQEEKKYNNVEIVFE